MNYDKERGFLFKKQKKKNKKENKYAKRKKERKKERLTMDYTINKIDY